MQAAGVDEHPEIEEFFDLFHREPETDLQTVDCGAPVRRRLLAEKVEVEVVSEASGAGGNHRAGFRRPGVLPEVRLDVGNQHVPAPALHLLPHEVRRTGRVVPVGGHGDGLGQHRPLPAESGDHRRHSVLSHLPVESVAHLVHEPLGGVV